MLLTNGRIYVMDSAGTVADTLVVREGRVLFAGRRGDASVPAAEPTIDLGGRAVLPGLVDAHAHLMHLARLRLTLDVGGRRAEAEIAALVEAAARRARPGDWLGGRGWDQNLWPGRRDPTRASLDRAAPRNPVARVRIDGHATWANSPALQAAGIDRGTRDPSGGRIARDAAGEPTGLLVDTAQELLRRAEPRPGEAEFDRAVREAITECLAQGLTGIHEMGADLHALAAYRRLLARGQFPFRNYVAVRAASASTWAHYRTEGAARPPAGTTMAQEMRAGVRYAVRTPLIALVLSLVLAVSMFVVNYGVLVPLLAREVFHQGAEAFGLLMAALGTGALAGAVGVATLGRSRPPLGAVVAPALVLCAATASLAVVHRVGVAAAVLFVIGGAQILFMTTCNTLLQTTAPDELRGRIVGLYAMAFAGMNPVGSLLLGSIAEAFGVPAGCLTGGGLGLAAVLALTTLWRRSAAARFPGPAHP